MESSMMRLQKNAGRWRPRSFLTAAPKSLITVAVLNLDVSHNRNLWWLTGRSSLVRGLVTAAAAVDGCRRCDVMKPGCTVETIIPRSIRPRYGAIDLKSAIR